MGRCPSSRITIDTGGFNFLGAILFQPGRHLRLRHLIDPNGNLLVPEGSRPVVAVVRKRGLVRLEMILVEYFETPPSTNSTSVGLVPRTDLASVIPRELAKSITWLRRADRGERVAEP